MHAVIRHVGFREAALAEAPALIASLALAEAFYRFHSFTLECLAFLATWFALSYLGSRARSPAPRG